MKGRLGAACYGFFFKTVYVPEGSFPEDTITNENEMELSSKATKGKMQNATRDLNRVHLRGSCVHCPLGHARGNIAFTRVIKALLWEPCVFPSFHLGLVHAGRRDYHSDGFLHTKQGRIP